MASIEFGNTWWGEKWLAALTGTDYSNRLPRGKRYARNGSVREVDVTGTKVSAAVQGSRRWPYKVRISLPKFTVKDKRAVVDAVTDNPHFLSQLLIRRLPPALFDEFQKAGVPLFPETWDDIEANCSCPDWAFCCKHIAAVIYLIANEVDKNPFLLFELHDFDIFAALAKKGLSVESHSNPAIVAAKDLIVKSAPSQGEPLSREERDGLLDRLDFSQIPPVRDELLSLLGHGPLFYLQKDFKLVLDKALKNFARRMSRETSHRQASVDGKGGDTQSDIFVDVSASVDADLVLSGLTLRASGKTYATAPEFPMPRLFEMLFAIPRGEIHSHDEKVIALSLLVHFAFRLLEQGAIMPEILQVAGGHRIRWIPALVNPKVREIFEAIHALSPHDLLPTPRLAPDEQVKTILSGILGHYVSRYSETLVDCRWEDITGVFFLGRVLTHSGKFEEQEVAESIALWLSRFYIVRKDLVPLVKIDETDYGFSLELLIDDRRAELREPVPLKQVLGQKRYAKTKFDVLKDVSLLADYFPEIGDFLASGGETKPEFSPGEFEAVLFRYLPTLKLLNIPILLPKGLDRLVRPKITAKVGAAAGTAKSYLSLDDMLNFQWQVAIGDQLLSAQDFKKLVRGYRGIVKLNDQFVYLHEKEIDQVLNNLQARPVLTPNEALQAVLGEEFKGAPLRLDDGVKTMIRGMLSAKPLPVPAALRGTLRDYQHRGFEWLAKNARLGFGSLIADDMGLGKTIQILTLLLKLAEDGRLAKQPALVIVPTTLLTNWRREAEKFAPALNLHIYHGGDRILRTEGIEVFLTTYGLIRRDEAKFLKRTWAVVILDEAQAIKNHGTAQTRAVKKMKSGMRIAMTGTPVENRLSEYWSLLDFLNKGYLKGIKAFTNEFAMPIEVDRNQEKIALFRKVTAPFILRRLKSDKSIIKDLPDKVEINQYCQLGQKQAALYQTTMEQILQRIEETDDIERRGLVLKMITALKQICNHPSHFLKRKHTADPDASGKTARLLELLRSMHDMEEKVLIFTQYTEMGKLLQGLIAAEFTTVPLFLHGGLSRKKRDEIVDDFQTKPYVNTLLLSLKAGGTGLNLTAAQNVVHFDLWWNPAVEAQATDRAYRIGQTRNVMVHRLITRGTFEEKIDDMLKDKRELAELTVAAGEKWIGEYSNKDLRQIFALG